MEPDNPTDEPDTIYTAILTAEYRDEQDAFDVDIHHQEELPRHPPTNLMFGLYPVRELATYLEVSDMETAFTDYRVLYDLTVDEALKEYTDETHDDRTNWMTWLEDEDYAEFIDILRDTTKQTDEVYLLASEDKLSDAKIREKAQPYLHDLRQQCEQRANWSHWRSF